MDGSISRNRRPVTKIAVYIAERTLVGPWTINFLWSLSHFLRGLTDRYRDARVNYRAEAGQIDTGHGVGFNDHETNFFVRALMERGNDYVVELGALSLKRSQKIAALFPTKKIFALDVTQDFVEERAIGAITVGPNDLAQIARIANANSGRGLICVRGTLCYYSQPDLRQLFKNAFAHGFDFAIVEPASWAAKAIGNSWKRTRITFYHPFEGILRECGYELPDGDAVGRAYFNISGYGETSAFIYARHP